MGARSFCAGSRCRQRHRRGQECRGVVVVTKSTVPMCLGGHDHIGTGLVTSLEVILMEAMSSEGPGQLAAPLARLSRMTQQR